MGADEPLRPAEMEEGPPAGFDTGKALFQFHDRSWTLFIQGLRILHLVPGCVKRIALRTNDFAWVLPPFLIAELSDSSTVNGDCESGQDRANRIRNRELPRA